MDVRFLSFLIFFFSLASNLIATPLLKVDEKQFSLSLEKTQKDAKPLLRTSAKANGLKEVDVFALQNPNRLVIDLVGAKNIEARNLSIPKTENISSLRVGRHPDKTRIVLDLAFPERPTYSWSFKNGELLLDLEEPGVSTALSMKQEELPVQAKKIDEAKLHEIEEEAAKQTVQEQESEKESLALQQAAPGLRDQKGESGEQGTPKESTIEIAQETSAALDTTQNAQEKKEPIAMIRREIPDHKSIQEQEHEDSEPEGEGIEGKLQDSTTLRIDAQGNTVVVPEQEQELLRRPKEEKLPETRELKEDALDNTITKPADDSFALKKDEGKSRIQIREASAGEKVQVAKLHTGEDIVAVPSRVSFEGFAFEHSETGKPQVELQVSDRPKYTLIQEGQKRYRLTIMDCSISSGHLELPYFPPHDFTGFQMMQASSSGGNTHVLIHVDEGTQLQASLKGQKILLESR